MAEITEIGDAWNIDNPAKPVAEVDPNDITDVPFSIIPMIESIGYPYQSHTVICGPELQCASSSYVALDRKIVCRFQQASGQTLAEGVKYSATLRITFTNGEQRDRTVYFKSKAH